MIETKRLGDEVWSFPVGWKKKHGAPRSIKALTHPISLGNIIGYVRDHKGGGDPLSKVKGFAYLRSYTRVYLVCGNRLRISLNLKKFSHLPMMLIFLDAFCLPFSSTLCQILIGFGALHTLQLLGDKTGAK